MNRHAAAPVALTFAALLAGSPSSAQPRYFTVHVSDAASRAPVAGVVLHTTSRIALRTDVNGNAAFYEPGLMNRDVWFSFERPGYDGPAVFGLRGVRLRTTEGATGELALRRTADPDPGAPGATDSETRLARMPVADRARRFAIHVVDRSTGTGVPLVGLRAAGRTDYTDNAGWIAWSDPDRIGQRVSFEVVAPGYRSPDAIVAFETTPGGTATLQLERLNLAERLYRVTGQGRYTDSVLLGAAAPVARPLLDTDVMGLDSAVTALYRGRVFWIWGDTNRVDAPLGNFASTGARSDLPGAGGLDPAVGVNLEYFPGTATFVRSMAPPSPLGPTWIGALLVAPDARGEERLFSTFGVYPALADPVESGIMRFNDATGVFERALTFAAADVVRPAGGAWRVEEQGEAWWMFGNLVRVPARAEAMTDRAQWQVFSPQRADGTLDRRAGRELFYEWRTGVAPLDADHPIAGVGADESLSRLREAAAGTPIRDHSPGSIEWNAFRQRYVRVFTRIGGDGFLSEAWYAEADTPMGPWVYAQRAATHGNYTFYNPRQHPYFADRGGRRIYFEGTCSRTFSSAPETTPRYDYNQLMYRLDLDAPGAVLPVAVYDLSAQSAGDLGTRARLRPGPEAPRVLFQAPDRPAPGLVGFGWDDSTCADRQLTVTSGAEALFYAYLPGGAHTTATVGLFEWITPDGRRRYGVEGSQMPEGARPGATPVAYVWPHPVAVRLPAQRYVSATPADPDGGLARCADAGVTTQPDARVSEGLDAALGPAPTPDAGCGCHAGPVRARGWRLVTLAMILGARRQRSRTSLPATSPTTRTGRARRHRRAPRAPSQRREGRTPRAQARCASWPTRPARSRLDTRAGAPDALTPLTPLAPCQPAQAARPRACGTTGRARDVLWGRSMTFLNVSQVPSAQVHLTRMRDAFPGAAPQPWRSLYGTGAEVTVGVQGVAVHIRCLFAQGNRRPVPITEVRVAVATLGAVATLTPARSIPRSAMPLRFPHPGLADLGLLAAPATLVTGVFDEVTVALLGSLRDACDSAAEVVIDDDRVALSYEGWPADAQTLRRVAEVAAALAVRVPGALAMAGGAGASLEAHPEVRAMRRWQAARVRTGRALLAAVVIPMLCFVLATILKIATT